VLSITHSGHTPSMKRAVAAGANVPEFSRSEIADGF